MPALMPALDAKVSNENVTAEYPVTASADDYHECCAYALGRRAAQPTQQGFAASPAGIIIQTLSDMKNP